MKKYSTILFDLRPLETPSKDRGLGIYTKNLASSLLQIQHKKYAFNFTVTFTSSLQNLFKINYPHHFSKIPTMFRPKRFIHYFDPILSHFWNNNVNNIFPDLIHLPSFFENYYLSIPPYIKTVVTIHDLIPLFFPNTSFSNKHIKETYFRRLDQLKGATKIIAVSESSKRDLINLLKISKEKISVIYEGISPNIKLSNDKPKIGRPYILYVGATSYHKNILRTFIAFKNYIKKSKDYQLKLVIVCKLLPFELRNFEAEVKNMGIENKVIFTNFVSDEDLSNIYSHAKVLLFPSLYEGFGLPILEAFKCGIPVIASNNSSLPEVGGNAAIYVNPKSIKDITLKLCLLLGNTSLREKMIKEGFKRVKRFSWEKTAMETLKLYKEVLEG